MAWFTNKPRKRGRSGKKSNRLKKGSKAAKAWGRKMRALRLGGKRKKKNPLLTIANRKRSVSMARKKHRKSGKRHKKNRSYKMKGRPVRIIFKNRYKYRKHGRRRNALALRKRVPSLKKLAIQSGSVIGGLAAPQLLRGFLPPASSQVGMYIREAAAHLLPGIAATFVFNKSTSNLIWLGIGASAVLTVLKGQGIAVPGFSAGDEVVPVDAYAGAGELPMGSGDDNMPERLTSPLFAQ